MADAQDRQAIRGVLDAFADAFDKRDAGRAIELLTADCVAFDLAPPLAMDAAATHDAAPLQAWFDTWDGPIASEARDITIEVGGDIAYAYGLRRLSGTKVGGEQVLLWFRATACLRREAQGWRIAHMHDSVPFAMDGSGKALLDLKPTGE